MKRCALFERGEQSPLCHYQDTAMRVFKRYEAKEKRLCRLVARLGVDVDRAKKYGLEMNVPNGAYEAFNLKGRICVCTTGGVGRCEYYRTEPTRQAAVLALWKKDYPRKSSKITSHTPGT